MQKAHLIHTPWLCPNVTLTCATEFWHILLFKAAHKVAKKIHNKRLQIPVYHTNDTKKPFQEKTVSSCVGYIIPPAGSNLTIKVWGVATDYVIFLTTL